MDLGIVMKVVEQENLISSYEKLAYDMMVRSRLNKRSMPYEWHEYGHTDWPGYRIGSV